MALKDWKEQTTKTQEEYGGYRIWIKKGTNIQIVYSDQSINAGPKNNISTFGNNSGYLNRDFKTKSQALAFAKSYMRTH